MMVHAMPDVTIPLSAIFLVGGALVLGALFLGSFAEVAKSHSGVVLFAGLMMLTSIAFVVIGLADVLMLAWGITVKP